MNEPKKIRNVTNKPIRLYIGNRDGDEKTEIDGGTHFVYRESLTHTKYIRADLVEALVKACEPINALVSNQTTMPDNMLVWDIDSSRDLLFADLRIISTALKALGE